MNNNWWFSFILVISGPTGENSLNKYELLCDVTLGGEIPLQKFRSPRTGLTVIVAQVEGPLVNGYFALGL